MELTDTTRHTILDAYAGKEYIIQLAAKDMEIGTWSDWSVAVHATPWMEEPSVPITSTTEAEVIMGTTHTHTHTHTHTSAVGPLQLTPPRHSWHFLKHTQGKTHFHKQTIQSTLSHKCAG